MLLAFEEIDDYVIEMPNNDASRAVSGQPLHFAGAPVVVDDPARDQEFGVVFPGALRARRMTEYCQWQEHQSRTTRKDRNGNEKTTVKYYYTKGWHRHRIISLVFDQPANHHNPQRDPFPDTFTQAPTAAAGAYEIPNRLIPKVEGWQQALFTPHAEPEYTWWDRTFNTGDRKRFYPLHHLDGIGSSVAANEHKFKYIGGGYFYSPYEMSSAGKFLKMAGQFAEGSLFDWQIGDLMGGCTPGDIRVHYEVVAPAQLSFVGTVKEGSVVLSPLRTSSGYEVGLLHPGDLTAEEMFQAEAKAISWSVFGLRLLLVLWGLALVKVFDIKFVSGFNTFIFCVGLAMLASGFIGVATWAGIELQYSPLLLFLTGCGVSGVVWQSAHTGTTKKP